MNAIRHAWVMMPSKVKTGLKWTVFLGVASIWAIAANAIHDSPYSAIGRKAQVRVVDTSGPFSQPAQPELACSVDKIMPALVIRAREAVVAKLGQHKAIGLAGSPSSKYGPLDSISAVSSYGCGWSLFGTGDIWDADRVSPRDVHWMATLLPVDGSYVIDATVTVSDD